MRIISGKYFKKFINVVGRSRPPLKLIRQYIFDFIENNFGFKEKVVLDLCSGSGSFGLEALSREAEFAYFFEEDYQIAQNLRKTINDFGINNAKVIIKNVKYLPTHNLEYNREAQYQRGKTDSKQEKEIIEKENREIIKNGPSATNETIKECNRAQRLRGNGKDSRGNAEIKSKWKRVKGEWINIRKKIGNYQPSEVENRDDELSREAGVWQKLSRRGEEALERRSYREVASEKHEVVNNRVKQNGETGKLMYEGNQGEEVISSMSAREVAHGKGHQEEPVEAGIARLQEKLADGEMGSQERLAKARMASAREDMNPRLAYRRDYTEREGLIDRDIESISEGLIYRENYPEGIIQKKLAHEQDDYPDGISPRSTGTRIARLQEKLADGEMGSQERLAKARMASAWEKLADSDEYPERIKPQEKLATWTMSGGTQEELLNAEIAYLKTLADREISGGAQEGSADGNTENPQLAYEDYPDGMSPRSTGTGIARLQKKLADGEISVGIQGGLLDAETARQERLRDGGIKSQERLNAGIASACEKLAHAQSHREGISPKGEFVVTNEPSIQRAQLESNSTEKLLMEGANQNQQTLNYKKADLIFFDPPFGHGYSQEIIDKIIKKSWVNKDAILIFRSGDEFQNKNKNYDLIAHKRIGCSFIYIYKIIC